MFEKNHVKIEPIEDYDCRVMSKPRRNLTLREKTLQAKEIKEILKSSANMDTDELLGSNVLTKKFVSLNNQVPTSIIRIVPGDIKKILVPKKSITKPIVQPTQGVEVSQFSQSTTSSSQLIDHSYLKKGKVKKLTKTYTNESDMSGSFEDEDFKELIQFNNSESKTNKNSEIKSNVLKRVSETSTSTVPEKIQKVHGEQCCCACRETLDVILQQQQEILKILRKDYTSTKKLDLLPSMPFDDINDFLDFDESLTHENVRDQFTIKLKKLLVGTDQKSISNIMSSIVTNELCRSITWIGVKNSLAFGTTNMVDMIVDLVQEHHSTDIDSVKTRIAEWLRRCGDRIGNEIRKNKRKAELNIAI